MSCSSRHAGWLGKVYESTNGNRKACQAHHKPPLLSSLLPNPRPHPGLKLIRILSEGNLKERVTRSQICPSFDVRRIVLTFTLRTSTAKTDRVTWRDGGPCLYLPPTTSSPPSYSHQLMQKCPLLKCQFSGQLFTTFTSGTLKIYYYQEGRHQNNKSLL